MKIRKHDCVVLTSDLTEDRLKAGDVGTVIHIHKDGVAFEVEFVTLTGHTIAVSTVEAANVRMISDGDVNHVRKLQLT